MKTKHVAAAVLALSLGTAQADPFAITYTGTIGWSEFPTIHSGQRYTVTLVLDNDGNSTSNQAWYGPTDLSCVIWRMNDAGNVVFAQSGGFLSAAADVAGRVRTNAVGQLDEMYDLVRHTGVDTLDAALKAQAGVAGVVDAWHIGGGHPEQLVAEALYFTDASGSGVPADHTRWTNPVPYASNCLDTTAVPIAPPPPGAGGNVAAVPTLGHAALALLGALVGGLGLRSQRRKDS